MKKIIALFIFLFSLYNYGQDIRPIVDSIISFLDESDERIFDFKNNKDKLKTKDIKTYLNLLRKQDDIENSFSGEFNFGIDISDSQNDELVKIEIGTEMKKGTYPGELNFKSLINVQLKNGKFIENLSTLSMSYDHHFDEELNYEGYVFLKRSSNDYLNIDQRYEVGVGIIWNAILSGKNIDKDGIKQNLTTEESDAREENIKNKLTKKGYKDYIALSKYDIKIEKDNKENMISLCDKLACTIVPLSETNKAIFVRSWDRILQAIKKRESRVRLSFLVGLNYEVETTKDSLQLFPLGRDSIKQIFNPRNLVRLVVAPNIELKINELSLNSRCYFKLGVSKNDLNDKVNFVNDINNIINTDKKTDFRIEWISSATLKLNKKISVKGSLNYVFINAPRRAYYNLAENIQIDPANIKLLSAANRFTNFKIGFTYKL